MATQTALIYTGGAFERLANADTLGVGSGVVAQGTNAAFALDATGSGAINIGAGAGTGGVNIGTGAAAGALALSRAGVNTAVAGTLSVVGAATFTGVINANGNVERSGGAGTLAVGTGASTNALTIGSTGVTTTFPGSVAITQNLTVTGTETVTGGQTFTGLMTVTSAASGGAASALGPEELLLEMTEAATGVATIKNPGFFDFVGTVWNGAASVASAKFGKHGCVIDAIDGSGGITGLSYVWRNAADAANIMRLQNTGALTIAAALSATGATLSGLTAQSFLYSGAGGLLATTAAPTNGQLLVGSTGAVPVAAALTGTANQITVANGAGTITLSTPQDIATSSSPTFANLALGAGGDITSIDEIAFADGAAAATAAGRMRRNAATLTWHDGTAARTVNFLEVAQTVTAKKTHTANVVLTDTNGADRGLGHNGWTADATAGAQVLTGDAVRLGTTANTVFITDATTSGTEQTATAIGVYDGTDVVALGSATANFATGLTLAVGDKVYLSPGSGITRGALTNVAPSTTNQWSAPVGYVISTLTYAGATAEPVAEGTAWPTGLQARVFVQLSKPPVKV